MALCRLIEIYALGYSSVMFFLTVHKFKLLKITQN